MVDRQKVESILTRRFPAARREDVAAAANAIMGLTDEWEEIVDQTSELGYHYSIQCPDICYLAREVEHGGEFRLFKRRTA